MPEGSQRKRLLKQVISGYILFNAVICKGYGIFYILAAYRVY